MNTSVEPDSLAILDALDRKVDLLRAACDALIAERQALQTRVVELEAEKSMLIDKIDTTRVRLEALMTRLPEE